MQLEELSLQISLNLVRNLQKDNIREYTSLLENYLQIYVKITDDPERKEKLNDELEKIGMQIM